MRKKGSKSAGWKQTGGGRERESCHTTHTLFYRKWGSYTSSGKPRTLKAEVGEKIDTANVSNSSSSSRHTLTLLKVVEKKFPIGVCRKWGRGLWATRHTSATSVDRNVATRPNTGIIFAGANNRIQNLFLQISNVGAWAERKTRFRLWLSVRMCCWLTWLDWVRMRWALWIVVIWCKYWW